MMRVLRRRGARLAYLWCCAVGLPLAAAAQAMPPTPISITELNFVKKYLVWPIAGRVTTLSGNPVGGAKVFVDVGMGPTKTKTIETNLQGEFHAEFTLEADASKKISVKLAASKEGFHDALETEEFDADVGARPFDLFLREQSEDPDLLSQSDLVAGLAPKLRAGADRAGLTDQARKDYERALEEFLDRHDAGAAVSGLVRLVKRLPDCLECRTLLALAQLEAGSWSSVRGQLSEAAALATSEKPETVSADPYLILGVIETWQGQREKAAGHLARAQQIEPQNALVLQESGRVLFLERKWELAEQTLERAIKAGASPQAHLLRARALLEAGDNEEAEKEMNQYLGGRKPSELALADRLIYAQLQDRLTVMAYERAKSVIDRPLDELLRAMPELRGIEPSRNQNELPMILAKVGETVDSFFRRFPNTVSVEDVRAEILRPDGKVAGSFNEKFQYLMLARPERWGLGLTEYRTSEAHAAGVKEEQMKGFMRTAGFASASVVYHPDYQPGSKFRLLGRQVVKGRPTLVVAFAQQPDKAVVLLRFDANGISVPALEQGVAWIDAANHHILRMRTELLTPAPRVKLTRQTTEIQFNEVRFKELASALWLPREVTVTVEWRNRQFRNLHHYSEYRLFKVETEEKRREVQLAPGKETRPN